MGFWNFNKKKEGLTEDRIVKEPDLSEFVVPVFVNPKPIRKTDEEMIQKLQIEFLESGVISNDEEDTGVTDDEATSLIELFEEANANAKNEKDFHSNIEFDEEIYEGLDQYENSIIFDDEVDSYGNQIQELTSNYDEDEYY